MNTGADFVKKIGPAGCIIFLLISLAFFVMCFKSGGAPIKGYSVPHDSDYFAEHLDELKAELETNVFPHLDGIRSCELTGKTLTIAIDSESFDTSSEAISHYYRDELFNFQKIN